MRIHRRLKTGLSMAGLCVLGASSLAGCSADSPGTDAAPAPDGPATVTLRLTGQDWPQADVSVTAQDKGSPIERVSLPWSKEFDYDSPDTLWLFATFAYIPGRSTTGATLTCEVLVDGKPVDTVTAKSHLNDEGDAIVEEHAVCSYTPGQ